MSEKFINNEDIKETMLCCTHHPDFNMNCCIEMIQYLESIVYQIWKSPNFFKVPSSGRIHAHIAITIIDFLEKDHMVFFSYFLIY